MHHKDGLTASTVCRFNKEGAPGKKITCNECHVRKLSSDDPLMDMAPSAEAKTVSKKRKLAPKLTPELLVDREKVRPEISLPIRGDPRNPAFTPPPLRHQPSVLRTPFPCPQAHSRALVHRASLQCTRRFPG
jgi:hypothetical protein